MPSRRAVLATCGSALVAGCAGLGEEPTVSGSWSHRGYDRARTGVADAEFSGPESPLTAEWTESVPSRGGSNTSPLLADGSVYVGYTEGPPALNAGERTVVIEAVDSGTGDSQWTATVTTTRENSGTDYHADSLALAGGETVLIQTSNGLCAVDADGTEKWCFDNVGDGQLSHQTITPGVDDETAYVGHYRQIAANTSGPVFYAVDIEEGTERWRHEFTTWGGRLVYSPAVADGVVYLAEHGEGVKALETSDGTELWREPIPADEAPTVADGTVFVTYTDDEYGAAALDADTGDVRWRIDDEGGGWSPRHLAATDDAVYYVADGRLLARDAATGDRRWTDADRQLVADDVDSEEADEANITVEAGTPAVVDDRIYVGGRDLVVVDRETGSVLTRYETDRGLGNSVAVADGWLYANSDDTLYGLTECQTELFDRCLR